MSRIVQAMRSIGTAGIRSLVMLPILLVVSGAGTQAGNYVNWKGGFWLEIPEDWEKANYQIVDRYLMATDTMVDILDYEAVFAPRDTDVFFDDAYLVITFDSTGKLSDRQSDSVLNIIAEAYSKDIEEAPIVQYMSDLTPGVPQVDRDRKTVSVLSEMGYREDALNKLWLYMQLNDIGLVSLYFYSPDSTFERNKPVFETIANSLSFENLREASQQELVFTDVSGGEKSADTGLDVGGDEDEGTGWIPYLVLILIVLYLIWRFAVRSRMRKNKTHPE